MTIVYALIARGKAVLAEFTATAGNFPTVTRVLLNKIPAEATRMSYVRQHPDASVFVFALEARTLSRKQGHVHNMNVTRVR